MKVQRRHSRDYPGLLLLSATGPDTAAKSVRATLYQPDIEAEFVLDWRHDVSPMVRARLTFDGKPVSYGAAVAKLAPGVIHLVALAKIPGLMPNMSDDHLWTELSGPRYTTPLVAALDSLAQGSHDRKRRHRCRQGLRRDGGRAENRA